MDIREIIPPDGAQQRIYCPKCGSHCDLAVVDFDQIISDVRVYIHDLPILRCPNCGTTNLPDRSRLSISELHKKAFERGIPEVRIRRKKLTREFGFTKIPFLYDADDYYYIPGLTRPWDQGFLQPVFFQRRVLLKYGNSPEYSVQFASTTYGTIYTGTEYISFGLNRNGLVVMWLGDIAKMPEQEQYYLRSENVASDHSIGSEFYDGQIETKFTDHSRENKLFRARSSFLTAAFEKFGRKIAHLDQEAFEVAQKFNPPVVDTDKERRHVGDALNKIYIESLDNSALAKIGKLIGAVELGSGSLKRLQAVLEKTNPSSDVAAAMMPLYVLYDLRVAYSHLTSKAAGKKIFEEVCKRLNVPANVDLQSLYDRLTSELMNAFAALTLILRKNSDSMPAGKSRKKTSKKTAVVTTKRGKRFAPKGRGPSKKAAVKK